jgi:hypothetical protein
VSIRFVKLPSRLGLRIAAGNSVPPTIFFFLGKIILLILGLRIAAGNSVPYTMAKHRGIMAPAILSVFHSIESNAVVKEKSGITTVYPTPQGKTVEI